MGQAQKELYHNEALEILDLLVAGAVEEPPRPSPPQTPIAGASYIIGAGATGDWQGREKQIAGYTAGGWRFLTPVEGVRLEIRSTGQMALFRAGSWEIGVLRGDRLVCDGLQVVGPRAAAIADPTGGSQVDQEARIAIAAVLQALRTHGLIQAG